MQSIYCIFVLYFINHLKAINMANVTPPQLDALMPGTRLQGYPVANIPGAASNTVFEVVNVVYESKGKAKSNIVSVELRGPKDKKTFIQKHDPPLSWKHYYYLVDYVEPTSKRLSTYLTKIVEGTL